MSLTFFWQATYNRVQSSVVFLLLRDIGSVYCWLALHGMHGGQCWPLPGLGVEWVASLVPRNVQQMESWQSVRLRSALAFHSACCGLVLTLGGVASCCTVLSWERNLCCWEEYSDNVSV